MELEGGGKWYAARDSVNINYTNDSFYDGVDIETISDIDTITASKPIEYSDDLEDLIVRHYGEMLEERGDDYYAEGGMVNKIIGIARTQARSTNRETYVYPISTDVPPKFYNEVGFKLENKNDTVKVIEITFDTKEIALQGYDKEGENYEDVEVYKLDSLSEDFQKWIAKNLIMKSRREKGKTKYAKGGKMQGYNARGDEELGMTDGKESRFQQSKKDRRDEMKGENRSAGNKTYGSFAKGGRTSKDYSKWENAMDKFNKAKEKGDKAEMKKQSQIINSITKNYAKGGYVYEESDDPDADFTFKDKEEVMEFISEHNEMFETDYKSVDAFNKGEEYRKITKF